MNSGIYIRVENKNLLLEDMSESDRLDWLNSLSKDGLIRTVNILSRCLKYYEDSSISNDYEDYVED